MSTDAEIAQRRDRQGLPTRWPVLAPLALLGVALILRIVDIYVLRLDELLGETILPKSLSFALVVGYIRWGGQRLSANGLHSRNLGSTFRAWINPHFRLRSAAPTTVAPCCQACAAWSATRLA